MALELDARFTFDALVVGPANRLAVAAARRVAESPGATYNPLFIYSGSGLGKTHLLTAIGHEVQRLQQVVVTYETVEHLMDQISRAIAAGEHDAFRSRLRDVGVVLLDDVQFLAGQRQVQEELIRAWDGLIARGGQVVLTCDRPPQDIDALDQRLVSRLSGGLIVDMGAPDYETRVAIARRKADERGQPLAVDVLQALARFAFTNVRELQGALNRIIAFQELEQRAVEADEVGRLLGTAAERGVDEFGEFLADISGTVGAVVDEADTLLADAILAWEGEGFRTRRLESALTGTHTVAQAEQMVLRYEQDVARLRQIEAEIRQIDPAAPELDADALRDPDRLAQCEALLAGARERLEPPPAPPPGVSLSGLPEGDIGVRSARAVAAAPGAAYNPLFIQAPADDRRGALLAALGNELVDGGLRVAFLDAVAFEAELVDALARGRLEHWRARYRRADALVLDGLDALEGGERTHEELFNLFEDFLRRGAQLVFAATAGPGQLPAPDRLRTRLESGLVVELDAPAMEAEPGGRVVRQPAAAPAPETAGSAPAPDDGDAEERAAAPWLLSREKVLWAWPYVEDFLVEPRD